MFLTLNMEFISLVKHVFFFTVWWCQLADPEISEPWGAVEFLVSGDCLDVSWHIAYTHSLCFWNKRQPGLESKINIVKPQANIDSLKVMILSLLKDLLIEIQRWLYVLDFYMKVYTCSTVKMYQKIQKGEVGVHRPWIRLRLYNILLSLSNLHEIN